MARQHKPTVSPIEFLVVHLLLVVSVLGMSWAPVVYLMRTVQLHTGGGF